MEENVDVMADLALSGSERICRTQTLYWQSFYHCSASCDHQECGEVRSCKQEIALTYSFSLSLLKILVKAHFIDWHLSKQKKISKIVGPLSKINFMFDFVKIHFNLKKSVVRALLALDSKTREKWTNVNKKKWTENLQNNIEREAMRNKLVIFWSTQSEKMKVCFLNESPLV